MDNMINTPVVLSSSEFLELKSDLINMVKRVDEFMQLGLLKTNVSGEYIIDGSCTFFAIKPTELRNRLRKRNIVDRRRMVALLLRSYTDNTTQEIAYQLGYKNHATAIHHIREAQNLISDKTFNDRDFKITYNKLLRHLKL